MSKTTIKEIKQFIEMSKKLKEDGFDIYELIEEGTSVEITPETFFDFCKKNNISIYLCEYGYLNADYEGISFYTEAECDIKSFIFKNKIKFKMV